MRGDVPLDLATARARLRRASKYRQEMAELRVLDRESGAFSAVCTPSGKTVRIEASYSAHPDLAIVFGDWLANLRSGLDYLFFQLAIADTGRNPPSRSGSRMFPIKESAEQFDAIRRTDVFHGMSAWSVNAIESMQPYHTKYGAQGNALLWLHDLARRDRHRTPFQMGALVTRFEARVHPTATARAIGMETIDPDAEPTVVAAGEHMYLGRVRCPSEADALIMKGRIEVWIDQDLEIVDWYRQSHRTGQASNIRNDTLEERMKFIEWYFGAVIESFEQNWNLSHG